MNCSLGDGRFKPSVLGEQTYDTIHRREATTQKWLCLLCTSLCFLLEAGYKGRGWDGAGGGVGGGERHCLPSVQQLPTLKCKVLEDSSPKSL